MNEKINQWLAFIDDYDRGLVNMAEKKNKTLEKARIEMNYLTGDEEVKRLVELREKWEMDYNSEIGYAKEEGIAKGIEEGKKEKAIETAQKLKQEGLTIELIMRVTGLTQEEIENL